MSYNPYLLQICQQTGMSRWEASREVQKRATCITDAEAQRRGYATAVEYEDALHEFLNGQ